MVLSPDDIHNKEFSTKLRGYNIDEVNDFLEQIIKDYQITLKQNKDLQERLDASEGKLKYFNELKDSLNQSILVAQEAADKVKTNSKKEADIITREAQKQASDIVSEATDKSNQMIDEASQKAKRLSVETDDLKKQTRVFRQRLQVMLESQLEVVKSKDWDQLLSETNTADYTEIQHVLKEDNLDNGSNASVNSEATVEITEADSGETPVADGGDQAQQQTVVIFPDDDDNNQA
ncbi:DivIVA domain-containing protein [Lactiplantibacillus garii]|uniref:DivIVA domain-containing protein n=1 Tax=Lactiplantibacillus garii TaxID=2306423 RepID=A0A426DAF2_9LACO|nr:DivIVA domain-containing protein [Lactiplantibacillus garii]RRK11577.1 DivIVA domain-containing protein [Lactiplantibacillus garii]